MRYMVLCIWLLELSGTTQAAFAAEGQQPVALRGQFIMVQAEIRGGELMEQFYARREGEWVQVGTTGQTQGTGPVLLIPAQGPPQVPSLRSLSLSDKALIEEFSIGPHRVIRTLTLMDDAHWIRVATKLEPSGKLALREFSDHLKFLRKPDWSFSPSVGGFNSDAQYKAPLVLVQADRVALGIVPDVSTLGRVDLKRCNHALDLDVPRGPTLAVGFMPARLASHSVYAIDTNRIWTAETPVENNYYFNGVETGPWRGEDLEKGLPLPLPKELLPETN